MNSMINMFLTQARQTIIQTKIALESVATIGRDYGSYDPFNDETTFGGSANPNATAANITPGFYTGEDLPKAWE